mmetsp:Transcript_50315/g.145929  ORF Transcript_50315/g.145929 Transcript_50315/m.145929 type:complete len:286 (+) Transcript_50315:824-1681(+)
MMQQLGNRRPAVGIFLEHLTKQLLHLLRDASAIVPQIDFLTFHAIPELRPDFLAVEDVMQRRVPVKERNLATTKQLKQHDAQRPHVCLVRHLVEVAGVAALLDYLDDPRPCLRRLIARVAEREARVPGQGRAAEVAHLDVRDPGWVVLVERVHDEDVVGLQVVVHHALGVHEGHALHGLAEHLRNPPLVDVLPAFEHAPHVVEEVASLRQLRDHEDLVLVLTVDPVLSLDPFDHLHAVRVLELPRLLELFEEDYLARRAHVMRLFGNVLLGLVTVPKGRRPATAN